MSLAAAAGISAAVVTLPIATESLDSTRARQVKHYGAGHTDQLLVQMVDPNTPLEISRDGQRRMALSRSVVRGLARSAMVELVPVRQMSGGAHVLRLPRALSAIDVTAIAARLQRDPAVAHAEPDYRRFASQAAASDPSYSRQWSLWEATGGVNVEAAWALNALGNSVIVAVLDTGVITTNADLTARLGVGVDLVSEDRVADVSTAMFARYGQFATANDGNGRDADASDPGNWIAEDEKGQAPFLDCKFAADSDWHGTQIAGIISATRNNAIGLAGVAPLVSILPVRVLGKCGGYVSDVADGIRWAAGRSGISGAAMVNAAPAQVINLSLGSEGPCAVAEQQAINDARVAGVKAIVAAAGNAAGANATNFAPGNCANVITVVATDRRGSRAPYSSIGAIAAIAAPGGCSGIWCPGQSDADAILTLSNTGAKGPMPAGDTLRAAFGTSEAAAHVSGVAALMLSANPLITEAQLLTRLKSSARPFVDCSCTTTACGAGLVDAGRAVLAATGSPPPALPPSSCAGQGTLIGKVFVDQDNTNSLSSGDTPISGVTVKLRNAAGDVVATSISNDAGNFVLSGIPMGTYRLEKTQPVDLFGTLAVVGSAGGTPGIHNVAGIVVDAATFASGYHFPLRAASGRLEGSTYIDSDDSKTRTTADTPTAGVVLTLFNSLGIEIATTSTNSAGAFSFAGLRPGTYRISTPQPVGTDSTIAIVGDAGGIAGPNLINGITLNAAMPTATGYVFLYQPTPPPAPSPDPVIEPATMNNDSGGGGGGGGGCAMHTDGPFDPLLLMFALWAALAVHRRHHRRQRRANGR